MKYKRKFFGSLLWLIIFVPTFSNSLVNVNYINYPNFYERSYPKLAISGSISLQHGVCFTLSGFSNKCIEWSYICSPINVSIEVRALNTSQYNEYKANREYREYFILSNATDFTNAGNFTVPYSDEWHISFLNFDPVNNIINLTFNVTFHNQYHETPLNDPYLTQIDLMIIALITLSITSVASGIVLIIFLQKRNKKKILKSFQNNDHKDKKSSNE